MSKLELMDSIRQEARDAGGIGIGIEIEIGKENQSLDTTEGQEDNSSDTTENQEGSSSDMTEGHDSPLQKVLDILPGGTDEESAGEEISTGEISTGEISTGEISTGESSEEESTGEENSEEKSTGEENSEEKGTGEENSEESTGEESSIPDETEPHTETGLWEKITDTVGLPVCIAGGVLLLLLAVLGIWAFVHARRKKKMMRPAPTQPIQGQQYQGPQNQGQVPQNQAAPAGSVGKLHNVGRRRNQQDSFGVMPVAGGQFAVVADGMGGLSEGDKVSQQIVVHMLQDASGFGSGPKDRVLFELVAHANQEINRMLGVSDQYVSGSTVVAALVENGRFHWISVGDSRIYLYRNQRLVQLNREHTYEAELLIQAVNGEIPFEDVHTHPKRGGLTSFIGMGELKYIDGSSRGIRIQKGDRLLLMTDGVFNTLSEEEICGIVQSAGCAENVAAAMQERILAYGRDKQDNFTAVILDL